jgi:hypothetical protein
VVAQLSTTSLSCEWHLLVTYNHMCYSFTCKLLPQLENIWSNLLFNPIEEEYTRVLYTHTHTHTHTHRCGIDLSHINYKTLKEGPWLIGIGTADIFVIHSLLVVECYPNFCRNISLYFPATFLYKGNSESLICCVPRTVLVTSFAYIIQRDSVLKNVLIE